MLFVIKQVQIWVHSVISMQCKCVFGVHGFAAFHHQIMTAVHLYVCTLYHPFVKILVWFCVSIFSLCTQCVKTVLRIIYDKNSEAQGSKFIVSVKTFPRGPRAFVTAII
jgi:hypothetical protein